MWIKKREFAVYMVLDRAFGHEPFNLGEALDVLECFMSRRTAIRVIRRLSKLGWLRRIDKLTYRISRLEDIYRDKVLPYLAFRVERRLKSIGIEFESLNLEGDKIVVEVRDPPKMCLGDSALKIVSFRVG